MYVSIVRLTNFSALNAVVKLLKKFRSFSREIEERRYLDSRGERDSSSKKDSSTTFSCWVVVVFFLKFSTYKLM